jgi:uncharacterized delta-60 repeat protein
VLSLRQLKARAAARTILIAMTTALLTAPGAHAAAGSLDDAFGTNGLVQTPLNGGADVYDEITTSDGNIMVGGDEQGYGLAVERYTANGALDPSFDGDGIATTPISGYTNVTGSALAVDSSGRTLLAGYGQSGGNFELIVARYTTDGSLDSSFNPSSGHPGYATIGFPGSQVFAAGIGVQSDGKIVVGANDNVSFKAVRLLADGQTSGAPDPDGALDTSFATNGRFSLSFPGATSVFSNDLVVASDDSIVLGGAASSGTQEFALARLTPGGSLDSGFGGGAGYVRTPFGGGDAGIVSLALDGSRIVASGYSNHFTYTGLARYLSDGTLDSSFDGDGLVTTQVPGMDFVSLHSVLVAPSGRIAAAGVAGDSSSSHNQFLVTRLNSDGSPDSSFGTSGRTLTDTDGIAFGLVRLASGRLVAAGIANTGTKNAIELAGYDGSEPAPPTPPITTPPRRLLSVSDPVWQIQGFEVTQGSQVSGIPPLDGSRNSAYKGVKLADGGTTIVRVFLHSKYAVSMHLTGFRGATTLGSVTPSHINFPDLSAASADTKQNQSDGGYEFVLPPGWASGTISLRASVDQQAALCKTDPACQPAQINNVHFSGVRPFTIRLVALTDGPGKLPPEPQNALRRAINLVPQGSRPIVVPDTYAGYIDTSDLKTGASTKCTFWYWCSFYTRDDTNTAVLERLQNWDEANGNTSAAMTIGISANGDVGLSNSATVFPFLNIPRQACSIGGLGRAFTCARPVAAISGADFNAFKSGRPLTNAGHEIFHALGRPHASKNCGGGGGGLELAGESWPPDQIGMLNGVGLDRMQFEPNSGVDLPFVGRLFGFYHVIRPLGNPFYTSSYGKFETRAYDLMSYCASSYPDGDPYSWISPRGWDAAFAKLADPNGPRFTLRSASPGARLAAIARAGNPRQHWQAVAVTSAATGPRVQVDAAQLGDRTQITTMEPVTGRTTVPADTANTPHVVFEDDSGKTVSDTPMEALRTHFDTDKLAKPLTLLRALAPVPGPGVHSLSIELKGKKLATRVRSPHAPTVKILSPRRGTKLGKRSTVTLRWRARDRDRDVLQVTVDYSANGGKTWQRLFVGKDRGRLTVPRGLLSASSAARLRVIADDGFNRGRATTPKLVSLGAPPSARILSLRNKQRLKAGMPIVLEGQAIDDAGTVLSGRSLRWYVNQAKKPAGYGARITLAGRKAGKLTIRFVAVDRRKRATTRVVSLTVS